MTELFAKVFEAPSGQRQWLDALAEIASGENERVANGLLALAMDDPDPSFARGICLPFIYHGNEQVRSTARICLGLLGRVDNLPREGAELSVVGA